MKKANKRKLRNIFKKENGQAVVEVAVCLPLLLLLLLGIIDFGWIFYNQMSVETASREGARYAAANSGSGTLSADVAERAKTMCLGADENTTVTLSMNGVDAVVTVVKEVQALTPLPGIFTGGQALELTSSTTMRIG